MTAPTKPTRTLVTAALPYSNGRLHVGHIAGAYVPSDVYVRYLRSRGREVLYVCGSDDNGVAALIAARNEGIPVADLTAKYSARQKADFAALGIRFDVYGGTHQPEFWDVHRDLSQEFFRQIHERGYFTKRTNEQFYDPVAKQFLPDRYVTGTCYECGFARAYGDQCDNCGKTLDALKLINPKSILTPDLKPEVRTTTHWYLSLAKFEDALVDWLKWKSETYRLGAPEAKKSKGDPITDEEAHGPAWRSQVADFALGQLARRFYITSPNSEALAERVAVLLDEHCPDYFGLTVLSVKDDESGNVIRRTSFECYGIAQHDAAAKALADAGFTFDVRGGLPERAMTRDLTWGVPVPLPDDPDAAGKVLYVWFDAPIGYVSFTETLLRARGEASTPDRPAYEKWWCDPDSRIVNFIGEDNIVFHAIIWPAMQMAANERRRELGRPPFRLTSNVVANSFLNMKDGSKISKSTTPAEAPVWIEEYVKSWPADVLRAYLTSIAPETARSAFAMEDLVAYNNGVLGNALGNFFNRCLTFAAKYFDNRVPAAGNRGEAEAVLSAECAKAARETAEHLDAYRFKDALNRVIELARAGNKYFDTAAPFRTRQTDLPAAGTAINACLQVARALATLMAPFMPTAAARAIAQLGLPEPALQWDAAFDPATGAVRELADGHPLGTPEVLFPRLELPAAPVAEGAAASPAAAKPPKEAKPPKAPKPPKPPKPADDAGASAAPDAGKPAGS